jgi:hypothetical protein
MVYSWAIGLAKVSRVYHSVNSVIQYLRLSCNVSTEIRVNKHKNRVSILFLRNFCRKEISLTGPAEVRT